jgi:putative intracellular protease/amidase
LNEGIDVTIGGLQDQKVITCARQAKIEVDALFKDVVGKDFDAIILPGGCFLFISV